MNFQTLSNKLISFIKALCLQNKKGKPAWSHNTNCCWWYQHSATNTYVEFIWSVGSLADIKITQKYCPTPKNKTLQYLINNVLRKSLRNRNMEKTILRPLESDLLAGSFCSTEEKACIKFFLSDLLNSFSEEAKCSQPNMLNQQLQAML